MTEPQVFPFGDAQPNNLPIVHLKHDGNVQGMLGLASFRILQPHEIAFIEKIAENTAVTFAAAKIAERTNALLQETQQMTEQMRAQEEEMRQNMEELMATQEEVMRKKNEYLQHIRQLETGNEVLTGQSVTTNR